MVEIKFDYEKDRTKVTITSGEMTVVLCVGSFAIRDATPDSKPLIVLR